MCLSGSYIQKGACKNEGASSFIKAEIWILFLKIFHSIIIHDLLDVGISIKRLYYKRL